MVAIILHVNRIFRDLFRMPEMSAATLASTLDPSTPLGPVGLVRRTGTGRTGNAYTGPRSGATLADVQHDRRDAL